MKISKFNILFEKVMSQLAKEGGAAMTHFLQNQGSELASKISKIKLENIKPTLNFIKINIFDKLNIDQSLWTAQLGSVGKKAQSGDIDIAIRMDILQDAWNMSSLQDVKNYLYNKLVEFGFNARKVGKNLHFACPIQGTQNDGSLVQVDFFESVDLQYTKIDKYSPSQKESKYKGVYRAIFLRTILKSCSLKAAENITPENTFIAPDGRQYPATTFEHLLMNDEGFYTVTKSWKDKHGNIANREQKDVLPRKFLGRDLQLILDMIFGKNLYTINDTLSFETLWNNILMNNNFPYPEKREDIITTFYYDCQNKKIQPPVEVLNYLDQHGKLY